MDQVTVKLIEDKNEWEGFLAKHPEANFLQSWYWGEFHQSIGHKISRTGFYKNSELVGVMISIVEDAMRGRYLTVPGGPIINWQDEELVKAFVEEIKRVAQTESCVFVRVRPQLESSDFSKELFAKYGFKKAPMHLHAELTSQLDITKSEDELFAGMRKTTRHEIKKAMSLEVEVTTTTEPSILKNFYDLQIETSKRQKFVPFSYKFLESQFEVFSKADKVLLYTAKLREKILAQAFIIFYGDEAAYHYGASTEDGRHYPGAYLIQWEAIKEAKRRGIKRYNFWGVAPEGEKGHRFHGVSVFKRGFGGTDVSYLPAQDLVINKPRYLLNSIIENTRKIVRGL